MSDRTLKRDPKICVIMSVYNGLPYLKEAVKSILNQTYKNFEFIIVDDASRDKTWQFLKSLKDKRVKLIQNKKNLGLAASLNIAIRLAQGDFIARMDADDISLSNRFEEQIKYLTKHQEIDLCGTWVTLIDDTGKIVGSKTRPTTNRQIKRTLSIYPCIIHPTFMGKRDFFVKSGGYRSEFDFTEEYDLLMRARKNFKMANLNKKLLMWRLSNSRRSISQMGLMNKLDLRIKWESIKRDGIDLFGLYGLTKMFLLTYFMPIGLKTKLARLFKIA